jgi:hypothetical protein
MDPMIIIQINKKKLLISYYGFKTFLHKYIRVQFHYKVNFTQEKLKYRVP